MTEAEEAVLMMTETELQILFGVFFAVVVFLLIVIGCMDYEMSKLRKDNKLLSRTLEYNYKLEDMSRSAAQAMAREAERASWMPPGW